MHWAIHTTNFEIHLSYYKTCGNYANEHYYTNCGPGGRVPDCSREW
jgi:hypothetical protein